MAGGAGLNLPVHVGDCLFKVLGIVLILITLLVKIRQLFTGFPMNLFIFQRFLITLDSQYLHTQRFLAQAHVIMENRRILILLSGNAIICQRCFIFAVIQINMAANHAILHPIGVLVNGCTQMGEGIRQIVIVPMEQTDLIFDL